jgi:hypothetical protein
VLLPGFQKGRDIKISKGQGVVLAKKGIFALYKYKENLKNGQNFTPFRVKKIFSLKFQHI